MTLRDLRRSKKLTQEECARYLGIPLRTYQNYETDHAKAGTMKYEFMVQKLKDFGFLDESHGMLTVERIKEICTAVFRDFDVDYCYLFGSYAKGKATESSDVDLLVSTTVSGIQFFDLAEALREALHKKVDILNLEQLSENPELINEILKDGLRIYG
ncbi:MAG: nucleotidyltransferase domain-containing protein [Clostridia bacterium]|nr:nucleotidyltransferase domain-containing protein [Clostridia bacterium]